MQPILCSGRSTCWSSSKPSLPLRLFAAALETPMHNVALLTCHNGRPHSEDPHLFKLTLAAPEFATSTKSADKFSPAFTARSVAASATKAGCGTTVWYIVYKHAWRASAANRTALPLQCCFLQGVLPNEVLQHPGTTPPIAANLPKTGRII